MMDEPHVSGWREHLELANAAPRCGAKTRSTSACSQPAMSNGRCRLHGGKSTGPRTAEGLERSRKANWKHGFYSSAAVAERRSARAQLRLLRLLLGQGLR